MDAALVLWLQSDLYYKAVVSSASWCCERGFMQPAWSKRIGLTSCCFKAKKKKISAGIHEELCSKIRCPGLEKHDIYSYIMNNSMKLSPKICFIVCIHHTFWIFELLKLELYTYIILEMYDVWIWMFMLNCTCNS